MEKYYDLTLDTKHSPRQALQGVSINDTAIILRLKLTDDDEEIEINNNQQFVLYIDSQIGRNIVDGTHYHTSIERAGNERWLLFPIPNDCIAPGLNRGKLCMTTPMTTIFDENSDSTIEFAEFQFRVRG